MLFRSVADATARRPIKGSTKAAVSNVMIRIAIACFPILSEGGMLNIRFRVPGIARPIKEGDRPPMA